MSWNFLYALDLIGLILFAVSYYFNCYRRGYRFDIWHSQLFLISIFPNLIMLPMSRNELNVFVLWGDFYAVLAVLPHIFLLTLLGTFAIFAGGALWRFHLGLGIRKSAAQLLNVIPQCSMMLMSSRSVLVFQALLCLLLQVSVLSIYFAHDGFGFDLRQYTFAHPELRPVALLASGYSVIIGSHCLARYIDKKEKILLAFVLLLTVGMLFFGSRGAAAAIYLSVLMCHLVRLRNKVNLIRLVIIGSMIVVIALYLGSLRAGQYSLSLFFSGVIFALFFGNNFSDLRDFAWVYSNWNHHAWLGKTYLAALMAFVPRFASEFRDTWGLGVATATVLGFDPHVHPGVRPGAFGEAYFNFGVVGVVTIGLILGLIIRRVDIDVKQAFASSQPSMMKAFASTMLLGVAQMFSLSSGFSGLYVLAAIYLFTWICLRVQQLFALRHPALAN